MNDTTHIWTGNVPFDATDLVVTRVERLVKRALKQGFPVPKVTFGEPFDLPGYVEGTTVRWCEASITASGKLALGDYEFIGTISALEGGKPFVTYAPGVERVDDTFATVNFCDHCQTTRLRNDTYIVRSADGVTKQVGSSCIKDFTGHDPSSIVGWMAAIESLSLSDDEIQGWNRTATIFYDPDRIVSLAARIVAKIGYVSKQKAYDEDKSSTGELLRSWLSASGKNLAGFNEDFPDSDASEALYIATRDAVLAKNGVSTNEWEQDILTLAAASGVQWRHVGILGSAVILGLRAQEQRATANRGESNFIGERGQRLDFTDVTVKLKREYHGDYGTSYVIRMSVNESDDLLTFASGAFVYAVNEGDVVAFTATVKGHELDRRSERPTTVLTRCTMKKGATE